LPGDGSVQPGDEIDRHDPLRPVPDDPLGRLEIAIVELQPRQIGLGQWVGFTRAGRHHDRVRQQPPGREQQRLGRRPVEQVGVVDQQRPGRTRRTGRSAQGRRTDREPVGLRA
jgi:hypothetical protein